MPPSLYHEIQRIQERRAEEDDEYLNQSEVVREALRGYYGLDAASDGESADASAGGL